MPPGEPPALPGPRLTARHPVGGVTVRAALLCLLLLASFGLGSSPAPAVSAEFLALRDAGLHQLALAVLNAEQPAPDRDRPAWLAWERARLALLSQQQAWAALESRVAVHPDGLPTAFGDLVSGLRARAALARGDGEAARAHLRRLVWQDGATDSAVLARWRELLVRSYLADNLTEDAHLAMLRYRQDYDIDAPELRELAARSLLRAGRAGAALVLLGEGSDPASRALRLLAELRSGKTPADTLATAARDSARAIDDDPRAATRFWAVAVEAASTAEDTVERIRALEAGLPAIDLPPSEAPFGIVPDDLWRAYRQHGQALGNRSRLLVGQDSAWYERASASVSEAPLDARALYATLARIARDPALRQAAHVAFADALATTPRGPLLLKRLYLDGDPGLAVTALPEALRTRLAKASIETGDLQAGARLYATLDTPPPESDAFLWELERARVLLRAGDVPAAGTALLRLARTQPDRTLDDLGMLLPVIEELEDAGDHASTTAVLEHLLDASTGAPESHRKLLLALADHRTAAGDHLSASRLYLRGAMLPGTGADDPTAFAARRAAATALAAAGLHDDAVTVLEGLIDAAPDAQRAPLEAQLRRIRGTP